jgi:hypothetical protein
MLRNNEKLRDPRRDFDISNQENEKIEDDAHREILTEEKLDRLAKANPYNIEY